MAEWNNNLILEFIQLYERYPALWNPKNSNHKIQNCLNDAWLDISKELSVEMSVATLKKKKESLMATYRTLRRKVTDSNTTGSGTQDIYTPSWFAYDAIDRFIRVTGKKIASLSSEVDVNENSPENEHFPPNDSDELLEPEEGDEVNILQNTNKDMQQEKTIVPLPQSVAEKRKQTAHNQIDSQIIRKHLKQATDALQTLTNKSQMQQTQVPPDGPALYGLILADKLRKLSDRSRIILQNKIDNLVFETELKEVDRLSEIRVRNISFSGNTTLPPLTPCSSYTPQTSASPHCTQQSTPSRSNTPQPLPRNTNTSNNAVHMLQNLNAQNQHSEISDYYASADEILNGNETTN